MLKNHLTKANNIPTLDRSEVVKRLADFRANWDGEASSLCDLQVSLGMTLYDVVNLLGLTPAEQGKVLGSKLYRDLVNRL